MRLVIWGGGEVRGGGIIEEEACVCLLGLVYHVLRRLLWDTFVPFSGELMSYFAHIWV